MKFEIILPVMIFYQRVLNFFSRVRNKFEKEEEEERNKETSKLKNKYYKKKIKMLLNVVDGYIRTSLFVVD